MEGIKEILTTIRVLTHDKRQRNTYTLLHLVREDLAKTNYDVVKIDKSLSGSDTIWVMAHFLMGKTKICMQNRINKNHKRERDNGNTFLYL